MNRIEKICWKAKEKFFRPMENKDVTKEKNYLNEVGLGEFVAYSLDNHVSIMMGKIGGSELFAWRTVEFGETKKRMAACRQLCEWSGFFPNSEKLLVKFSDIMKDALQHTDVLIRWYQPYEAYFIKKYAVSLKGVCGGLGGWAAKEKPWTAQLKGRKVLVIHPFADSIQKQYQRRELLFDNPEILPEFELKVLRAVQTIGEEKDERFSDWFEALQYMCDEAMKIDFDIALIGCGAYGLPLAAYLKKNGRSAVHVGGELQILFGIMGSRWEKNPYVMKIKNEYWTYPSESETPKGFKRVEDGCYW